MLKVYITLAAFMALAVMCYTAPARNQKFSVHVGIGKPRKNSTSDNYSDSRNYGGNYGRNYGRNYGSNYGSNYGRNYGYNGYKQLMAAVQAKLRANAAKAQHHPNHITSSRPSYDYPGSLQTQEQHKSAETQEVDCLMVKTNKQCNELCRMVLSKDQCDEWYPMVSSQNDELQTQEVDCLMVKTNKQCNELCRTVLSKDQCDEWYPMVSSQNDELQEAAEVFLAKLEAAVQDEDTKEDDEE